MADKATNVKKFSLKPIEMQVLKTKQDLYFADMSNFLSFIALERLAYPVTEKTKYVVEGDTLTISEDPNAVANSSDAGTVPPIQTPNQSEAKSSVDTSADTSSAIKSDK